ncbi:hypothetical protein Hanom_Chr03g00228991 [Helianthus anomalus]
MGIGLLGVHVLVFRLRTRFETISLWIWKLCNLSNRGSPLTVYLTLGQEEVP